MQANDEEEILIIEEIERNLQPHYFNLPVKVKLFYFVTSILICIPNGFVIFFMLKKSSRTFLDNLIIYDCCLRKRKRETNENIFGIGFGQKYLPHY